MPKPKNQAKYWLTLTGIAVQMGVIIYLGAQGGKWLDEKYNADNRYTIICTLAAVVISLYLVVKQTNKLNS